MITPFPSAPPRSALPLALCACLLLGCDSGSGDGSLNQLGTDSGLDASGDTGAEVADGATSDTMQAADVAPDTLGDTADDTTAPSGTISIYLTGDATHAAFDDGLSGQTPVDFRIALSAYEVMTSSADPNPQLCFDHGDDAVVADLAQDNLMGQCDTASLNTATYTYGRVRVEWSSYTVQATFHYLGVPYPGSVTFFRAYSQTTYEGESYAPNTGWIAYHGVVDSEIPWTYPAFEGAAPLTMELVDGDMWMTFPYTDPLFIDSSNTDAHWARFHWEIGDAFRWQDKAALGFVDGTWDFTQSAATTESLGLYGVSGYHVTASTD